MTLGLGIENLSLLLEGSTGVQATNSKQTENQVNQQTENEIISPAAYGINARPALSYTLSDRIDVLAYCDFLTIGYSYQYKKRTDDNYKSTGHNFNFGVNTFSDLLSIGFIYKF